MWGLNSDFFSNPFPSHVGRDAILAGPRVTACQIVQRGEAALKLLHNPSALISRQLGVVKNHSTSA